MRPGRTPRRIRAVDRQPLELPPHSLRIWNDGHTFVAMSGYVNTGICVCMMPEAQEWCFEHIGRWIIRDHPDTPYGVITFNDDADMLVFKMYWAGRQ